VRIGEQTSTSGSGETAIEEEEQLDLLQPALL